MGTCCANNRTPEKNSRPFSEATTSPFKFEPTKGYVKKVRGLTANFKISSESFHSLKDKSIEKMYKWGATLMNFPRFIVCEVTHIASGIPGLMKIVKKSYFSEPKHLEDFFETISIQKSLDHPHIAKLYELLEDDTYYYMIFEDLRGELLYDRLIREDMMDEAHIVLIMRQILAAVAFIHRKDIVNGNICLENFFFVTGGKDYNLKLFDFSFAKKLQPDESYTFKYPSAFYAAPEVVAGDGYDKKSEMWACGVLFYLLFNGGVNLGRLDPKIPFQPPTKGLVLKGGLWEGVSPQSKNLLTWLITSTTERRISATDALKLDLFERKYYDPVLHKSILHRFQLFKVRNHLHQLLLHFITDRILPPSEKILYESTYELFDTNFDGSISKKELITKYSKLRNDPVSAPKEIERIISYLDVDLSGELTFTGLICHNCPFAANIICMKEFLMVAVDKVSLTSRANISKAFKLLDIDSSGGITKEELSINLGISQITEKDWEEMMTNIDSDDDHEISFQELSDFLNSNANSDSPVHDHSNFIKNSNSGISASEPNRESSSLKQSAKPTH